MIKSWDHSPDYTVILPRHLLKDLDPKEFSSWSFWKSPVGSRPYRFVRHVPKIMMEFEINSEYHGKTPMIKYVILKNVGNPIIELLNGNVDASSNVGPDLIKILDDAENDWAPGWEERRNLKIWAIFQEDFPLTYLHPLVLVSVAHRRIKGLERSHQIHPEFSMEHLWIEEDK